MFGFKIKTIKLTSELEIKTLITLMFFKLISILIITPDSSYKITRKPFQSLSDREMLSIPVLCKASLLFYLHHYRDCVLYFVGQEKCRVKEIAKSHCKASPFFNLQHLET